jgi:hypothetical protein
MDATAPRKQRFTWGRRESLLVICWFVGFMAYHMVSEWNRSRGIVQGECFFGERWIECSNWRFLLALLFDAGSQFLTLINIALSVVVIYGILGVMKFVEGLRGKKKISA